MDYSKICFVVMPFGSKSVEGRAIDFDYIYSDIFEPSISTVKLPEGGLLKPRRTDNDLFSGIISKEMFEYLEYSRVVFADITGLNPNVMYELGHRHRARQSGTIIFRQTDCSIPFDINQIKAFPYEFEPDDHAQVARELISKVLTESLERNRLDSPIQLILQSQQNNPHGLDAILQKAENALFKSDPLAAIGHFKDAIAISPQNSKLHLEIGILYKGQGDWDKALTHFQQATNYQHNYSEAWREVGIAENKIFHKADRGKGFPTGETSLRKALEIDPEDFDALSSLGGLLKRDGRLKEAIKCYRGAAIISNGNSYPLLNAIKLQAQLSGRFELEAKDVFLLKRAQKSLKAQTTCNPPYNSPWSHFDLAEIILFLGEPELSLDIANEGLLVAEKWQAKTFLRSVAPLMDIVPTMPGLIDLIKLIQTAEECLSC